MVHPRSRLWKHAPQYSRTPRASAYKEIGGAFVFAAFCGAMWRSWHMTYRMHVDEFYKDYQKKLEQEAAAEHAAE
ncbi:hypothetical protein FVE85_4988 [Porphyridium purpureum]|uniref:Uncharacterized protein n=1 Tax=Porphyridium purpureum TaxID=35688 RepID=A0A5J4YQR0_PORPP|nr:hypothetical protein FVE85_4988 [Porphyridium purpureum]|eukprot:POR1812..scf236_6